MCCHSLRFSFLGCRKSLWQRSWQFFEIFSVWMSRKMFPALQYTSLQRNVLHFLHLKARPIRKTLSPFLSSSHGIKMCLLLLHVRKELMIIKILYPPKTCKLWSCDVAVIGEIFPGQSAPFLFWLTGLTPLMVTPGRQGKAEKALWALMLGRKLPVWICTFGRTEVSGNPSPAFRAAELP